MDEPIRVVSSGGTSRGLWVWWPYSVGIGCGWYRIARYIERGEPINE